MLSLGFQLYELTDRDLQTLLVEPVQWNAFVTFPGAALTGSVQVPAGIDRCVYIDNVIVIGTAFAAPGNYTSWRVSLVYVNDNINAIVSGSQQGSGTPLPLVSDGVGSQLPGAGGPFTQQRVVKALYPPGARAIEFAGVRDLAPVAAGSLTFIINGYLIPPGRIGRR